jgi:hypothetical protein
VGFLLWRCDEAGPLAAVPRADFSVSGEQNTAVAFGKRHPEVFHEPQRNRDRSVAGLDGWAWLGVMWGEASQVPLRNLPYFLHIQLVDVESNARLGFPCISPHELKLQRGIT